MPFEFSTIMYVSNYTESISTNFIIGTATGITRLENNDKSQTFKLTIFYPTDQSATYVPKIEDNQVLSVNHCKFSLGKNDEIDKNSHAHAIFLSFKNKDSGTESPLIMHS